MKDPRITCKYRVNNELINRMKGRDSHKMIKLNIMNRLAKDLVNRFEENIEVDRLQSRYEADLFTEYTLELMVFNRKDFKSFLNQYVSGMSTTELERIISAKKALQRIFDEESTD